MSASINRRTLVKGASWAAPAVLASATVPAYAASTSNLLYWLDGSWDSSYNGRTTSTGCQTTFNISNDEAYGTYSAGFRVGHDNGGSPDTNARLTSPLYFYYAMPAGYANEFKVTQGPWVYVGKQKRSSLPDTYGNPIPTSSYDIHVFQWAGTKTGPALAESTMKPWDATNTLQATATSSVCVYQPFKAIAGYIGDFATDNGFSTQGASTIASKMVYQG